MLLMWSGHSCPLLLTLACCFAAQAPNFGPEPRIIKPTHCAV